jgi:thioredoxin reductase
VGLADEDKSMKQSDVAIIGAGPYGLSIAAHLKAAGVDFRIFGSPMDMWISHMPKGMHLKSEGFASSLFDPEGSFPLQAYCEQHGLPYKRMGSPVPLEVFSSYGLEFQRRFVPELEKEMVKSVRRSGKGFELTLSSGEVLHAQRVVVAVGLTHYAYLPEELAGLPQEFVSHSYQHAGLERFKGKTVGVIGAGSSALDLAALLHQAGATVQVVARGAAIRFHDPPQSGTPSLRSRIRRPFTGIGPGWKLWMCANLPLVFSFMPESFRIDAVRRALGPAPCWFTREQVVGKVKFQLESTVTGAQIEENNVHLHIKNGTGQSQTLQFDHLIAATGYRTDIRRLPFLDADILSKLTLVATSPKLSSHFESSVPNLFFVGVPAANTFGPLLRFAFGAGFAAPRLTAHLRRTARRTLGQARTLRNAPQETNATEPITQ